LRHGERDRKKGKALGELLIDSDLIGGRHARKAGCWEVMRDRFSELQTDWRWRQLPANPSLPKIPVNREIYREFIDFLRQVWRTDTAICHIQFG
jgi:hypothetical protein